MYYIIASKRKRRGRPSRKIRTTKGDIAIEELRVGMMVKTHDDGPLPIHWISSRKVRAIFTRN
ncbi:MAG: hypothetical protein EBR13_00860 [Rhodobacteraceae bacterium]|nr:hypothetical protein [Paracoccaceae bacterium]